MVIDDDIRTVEIPLPPNIRSYVMSFPDETYCIVLNANLNFEQRMKGYQHEIDHIKNGDYERNCADLIEINAHN